ncbi:hypothetical protein QDX25_05015 [Auritidibacter ignavus]|uniref:hypothetical protein n=1 Tax=Auritidibacter ignavus TaxID=678932 RepID=UPI00244C0174|nr:hypothetical protein [Auritidibacter ignavus]WGH82514.1 hypothetical protein QDX25_05015 [Auritidibacter ignavus]
MTTFRDNGGKLPAGLDYFHNLLSPPGPFMRLLKHKRRPIVKVRRIWRGPNPITGQTFSTWYWQCKLCDHHMNPRDVGSTYNGELCFTWADAQADAAEDLPGAA